MVIEQVLKSIRPNSVGHSDVVDGLRAATLDEIIQLLAYERTMNERSKCIATVAKLLAASLLVACTGIVAFLDIRQPVAYGFLEILWLLSAITTLNLWTIPDIGPIGRYHNDIILALSYIPDSRVIPPLLRTPGLLSQEKRPHYVQFRIALAERIFGLAADVEIDIDEQTDRCAARLIRGAYWNTNISSYEIFPTILALIAMRRFAVGPHVAKELRHLSRQTSSNPSRSSIQTAARSVLKEVEKTSN